MTLASFLSDSSTGNWADDVDDLPSAPSRNEDAYHRSANPSRQHSSYESHSGRQDQFNSSRREKVPFPTRPPYISHLGNLGYDVIEDDIHNLFSGLSISNVRLVKDRETNQFKGFAYVEFNNSDSLRSALEFSGEEFKGRSLRVEVAEPPKRSERESRDFRGDREDRGDAGWERKEIQIKPRPVSPSRSENSSGGRGGYERRDSYRSYGRDSRQFGSRDGFERRNSYEQSAPMQRKKLDLQPRTASISEDTSSPSTPLSASKPKVNPFGDAKPRDENEVMRKLEERKKEEESKKVEEERVRVESDAKKKAAEEEEERKRDEEKAKKEKDEKLASEARKVEKVEKVEKPVREERAWTRGGGALKPLGRDSSSYTGQSQGQSETRDRGERRSERGSGRGGRGGYSNGRGSGSGGYGRGEGRKNFEKSMPVQKEERVDIKSTNAFDLLDEFES
ncbi:hypothetical protein HK098_001663 [Nowakowskiella sp. JEL0407]|nr:hypothetical protein HK098_001663 [Nowakowskiella sp. JEL0407]